MSMTGFILAVGKGLSGWYFVLAGVFIVVLVLAGVIIVPWVRRRYHPSSRDEQGSVFDIVHLEKIHSQGLITDDEFRRLRRAALGLDMKPAKQDNSASSAPVGRDDEESDAPSADGSVPGAEEDNEDQPQEEL